MLDAATASEADFYRWPVDQPVSGAQVLAALID
jgi:hypothetical protein